MLNLSHVSSIMKTAAETFIMPRFQNLSHKDIFKKSATDYVTTADFETEKYLKAQLLKVMPGSVFVGEETFHTHRNIEAVLQKKGPIWIIDPIDGTNNFMAGNPNFCIMIALIFNSMPFASWIYAPAFDVIAEAQIANGAWLNKKRLRIIDNDVLERIVITHPNYQTNPEAELLNKLEAPDVSLLPSRSAGLEYIDLATNENDAAVFTWNNLWDHCAGLLIHREAGGYNACIDNSQFMINKENKTPIIAAKNFKAFENIRMLIE